MEVSPYDTDSALKSQSSEKILIKISYIIELDRTSKKKLITFWDHALKNTKSYLSKLYHFELVITILIRKERDINC